MEPLETALPLAVAFVTALLATAAVARLARLAGAIDRPSARGVNLRPDMPLWGGLAVAVAFGLGVWATVGLAGLTVSTTRLLAVGGGSVLLVAAGLWDDRFGMSAGPKLLIQLAAASLAVLGGFEISRLSDPWVQRVVELPRWPKNPDEMVSAYAEDLDISPLEIWQRALDLWASSRSEPAAEAGLPETPLRPRTAQPKRRRAS